MRRPRILDLYCGQGAASLGYYLVGFDVIGVDAKRCPEYPFSFIAADALMVLQDDELLAEFDAIHVGSPGRQLQPALTLLNDLLTVPWVVETGDVVPQAITLCSSHFQRWLPEHEVSRHCRFAANFRLPDPGPCWCRQARVTGVGTASSDCTRWIGEQLLEHMGEVAFARDHLQARCAMSRIEAPAGR